MQSAHSTTCSIFVSDKSLIKVVIPGTRTRGGWDNGPGTSPLQRVANTSNKVLNSLKFMAKFPPREGISPRLLFRIPWLFLGPHDCLFRQSRRGKELIFPSLATSLSEREHFRNGKGMKNSTCPANFSSLTVQKKKVLSIIFAVNAKTHLTSDAAKSHLSNWFLMSCLWSLKSQRIPATYNNVQTTSDETEAEFDNVTLF